MFASYSRTIEEGSLVLIFANPRQVYPVIMKKDSFFHHIRGNFSHSEMISREYGSEIHSKKGSVHLLHPSCERWSDVLPHRTQIVYTPDISVITSMLDIAPGSVVVESGTGSASLTHALARIIAPIGHVYTFEYHKTRVEKAKEEFEAHKLSELVTITEANVYESGFVVDDLAEQLDGTVDAIFLDLPEPWKAIRHTPKLFKKNNVGRICSFSPCIEQVGRTRASLVEHGYTNIMMVECLQKKWEVKRIANPSIGERVGKKRVLKDFAAEVEGGVYCSHSVPEMKGHTAYLTFASYLPSIE